MNERDGFLFYRSFWDAVNQLPAKDQLPILKAIIMFGLDGVEPDKLSPTQNAFFLLTRPVLEKGRKKAANGKKGGSKTKANGKQKESKTEGASGLLLSDIRQESNPTDYRPGMKDEGENDIGALSDGSPFTLFWNAYPENARHRREEAWEAWKKLNPGPKDAALILEKLEEWKRSKRWLDDNGAFIPLPVNFLDIRKGYILSCPPPAKQEIPKGASGQLGAAELEAIQRVLNEE